MDTVLGILLADSLDVLLVLGGADDEGELTLLEPEESMVFDELELLKLAPRRLGSLEQVLLNLLGVLESDVLLPTLEVDWVRDQVAVQGNLGVGALGADLDRLDDLVDALRGEAGGFWLLLLLLLVG